MDVTRKMKSSRLKCYLYSKFIWVLLCWDITGVAEIVHWKEASNLLSFYKCLAILKTKALEFKKALFRHRIRLRNWITEMIKILTEYGQKESRKNRVKLSDLLQLKRK